LRHTVIGYRQTDINKILENLVYSHMNMLGYKVSVGVIKGKEIDFVCEKQGERIYIQTAYLLSDKSTIEREFGNLLEIRDNYKKIVVSMDEHMGAKYKGIEQFNIFDFLLDFK
jgi:predicted AAA+ superfamily ATPase